MNTEKRNIDGYIEIDSFQIASRIVVLAEKPDVDEPYLVCNIKWDNPFNIEEAYDCAVTGDYLEAVGEFTKRINDFVAAIESDRQQSGLPRYILAANDCIPDSKKMNWEGKAIIINAQTLSPEYRCVEHQVALCTGGFGANPNSRGNAVYIKEILSGEQCRHERYNILGLADPAKMPEWVNKRLAELQDEKKPQENVSRPMTDSEKKEVAALEARGKAANSTLDGKLEAAKNAAARDNKDGKPKNQRGAGER